MNTPTTSEMPKPAPVRSSDWLCAGLKWKGWKLKKERGVYMLMGGGEILYVGQSNNMEYRIACHLQAGKIPFDGVQVALCLKRDMDAIERHLIELHDPPYNHTHTAKAHAPRGPRLGKWIKAHNGEVSHRSGPVAT